MIWVMFFQAHCSLFRKTLVLASPSPNKNNQGGGDEQGGEKREGGHSFQGFFLQSLLNMTAFQINHIYICFCYTLLKMS